MSKNKEERERSVVEDTEESSNAEETAEICLEGDLEVDDRRFLGDRERGWFKNESWYVESLKRNGNSLVNGSISLVTHEKSGTRLDDEGTGDGENRESDGGRENDENNGSNESNERGVKGCDSKRSLYFQCEACGDYVKTDVPCNARFKEQCEACARRYRQQMRAKYKGAVECMDSPKLLTLTLRKKTDEDEMTRDFVNLSKMFKYFRKQMKRKYGKKIERYVWVLHPPNHVHALIDAPYIKQSKISDEWAHISSGMIEGYEGEDYWGDLESDQRHIGESNPIAHITTVDNAGRGLDYVIGYMNETQKINFREKGINLEAMEGVHIIGSWGLSVTDDYKGSCPSCEATGWLTPVPKWAYNQWLRALNKPPPDGGGGENFED